MAWHDAWRWQRGRQVVSAPDAEMPRTRRTAAGPVGGSLLPRREPSRARACSVLSQTCPLKMEMELLPWFPL